MAICLVKLQPKRKSKNRIKSKKYGRCFIKSVLDFMSYINWKSFTETSSQQTYLSRKIERRSWVTWMCPKLAIYVWLKRVLLTMPVLRCGKTFLMITSLIFGLWVAFSTKWSRLLLHSKEWTWKIFIKALLWVHLSQCRLHIVKI